MDDKELEIVVEAEEPLAETVEPVAEAPVEVLPDTDATAEVAVLIEQAAEEPASTEPEQESLVVEMGDDELRAIVEAVVYVTEEPLTVDQLAVALQQKKERIEATLARLIEDNNRPERGLIIKEVAGGYKMGT